MKIARQIEIAAQVHEQVEHLRLDRHVEGSDRLVEDQEVRLHGERAGDGDALPLTAGKLVREAAAIARIEPDAAEHVRHVGIRVARLDDAVRHRSLARPYRRCACAGLRLAKGSWWII